MIEKSDFVVTYVVHSWGGAARFKELAEKKGKAVIECSSDRKVKSNDGFNI